MEPIYDYIVIFAAWIITIATPKSSAYRPINEYLLGMVILAVGLTELFIYMAVSHGVYYEDNWLYTFWAMYSACFAYTFHIFKATYLSNIMGFVTIFQLTMLINPSEHYGIIMFIFQLSLLIAGARGMIDAIYHSNHINSMRDNFDRRRHV